MVGGLDLDIEEEEGVRIIMMMKAKISRGIRLERSPDIILF
jgi:hypothetical protein